MNKKKATVSINGKVYMLSDDINKNLKLLNSLYKSIEEIYKDIIKITDINESNMDVLIRLVDLVESGIVMFEEYCKTIEQQIDDKIFKKKYYKNDSLYHWYKYHSDGIILNTWKFLATARNELIEIINIRKGEQAHETKV